MKKILIRILIVLLALILIAGIAIFAVWHNELSTFFSMKQLCARDDAHKDGSVYEIHVKGGFYLEDYIAQGGSKTDAELIAFITNHITKGLIPMKISESSIACSSFTAKTPDGDRLFARNYDFSKTNTCIVITEANPGRHASVSTVDLQFLGIPCDGDVSTLMQKITCLGAPFVPLDGVNDAGVACGIYMTYQGEGGVATDQNTDKPDLNSTMLLRLILDYADDVDEAVEIARSYDLHDSAKTSFHYMVADSTGRSAVLEWVHDTDLTDNDGGLRELVVTYNDNDAHIGEREAAHDWQWLTNFIIQPGYYENDEAKGGFDRYNHIYDRLVVTDGVLADEQAAMDILAQVGRRTWNPDSNSITVHSVVYNLTDKTALWIPNEHYDDKNAVFTYTVKK